MNKKIELLAPGGDIDSIKAAITAGADAIYCGLGQFNARNRATNIEWDDLSGIIRLAHKHDCQVFLTLNIIIIESEIKALVSLLNRLVNTDIDGIIVQDLGLLYLLEKYFKSLKIHASTQLTTHNAGQIKFLSRLAATRVNLSRELNIAEIKALSLVGHENNILSEVFVHGSNCIAFSGICYISSVLEGKSGNRGRCSQPCREAYLTTPEGHNFPLNLKDNSAFDDLEALYAAGVDSLKIEGRIKKFHYVYTVVNAWRKRLNSFATQSTNIPDKSELYQVFNRDFSNAFLTGDINKNMFIDNPRDNSARHFAERQGCTSAAAIQGIKNAIHATRTEIISSVKQQIDQLKIEKIPLRIRVSGAAGTPLKLSVMTGDHAFTLSSDTNLSPAILNRQKGPHQLDASSLDQRFGALSEVGFSALELDLDNLQPHLFLPFKELTALRNRLFFSLNGDKKKIDPVEIPRLKKPARLNSAPRLSVVISTLADLDLTTGTSADFYFQLPSCFATDSAEYVARVTQNANLTPWFPAVLIGENYVTAVEILRQARPQRIVTNNTGIAYAAYKEGIPWIAGPYLNCVNSFSLLCLKEKFNCSGSFISNEISQNQLRTIVPPEDFTLYYSIYHPILLLTSRQCLLHQIVGCSKSTIDEDCLLQCTKSATITNAKQVQLYVDKTAGHYPRIFNNKKYLNTDVVADLAGMFASFFIDLTDIETETQTTGDKADLIHNFTDLLKCSPTAKKELEAQIHPTTNIQYTRGI